MMMKMNEMKWNDMKYPWNKRLSIYKCTEMIFHNSLSWTRFRFSVTKTITENHLSYFNTI